MFSVCSVTNAVITKLSIQLALAKLAGDTNGRFLLKAAATRGLGVLDEKDYRETIAICGNCRSEVPEVICNNCGVEIVDEWLAIDEPQPDFDLWKLGVSVAVTIFIIWAISRLAF